MARFEHLPIYKAEKKRGQARIQGKKGARLELNVPAAMAAT
jgi:hypothetical protein